MDKDKSPIDMSEITPKEKQRQIERIQSPHSFDMTDAQNSMQSQYSASSTPRLCGNERVQPTSVCESIDVRMNEDKSYLDVNVYKHTQQQQQSLQFDYIAKRVATIKACI